VGLGKLPICLIEYGLERPRIERKEQLSFSDERAFGVVLREQVAAHLRPDFGVDHPVQGSDPFAVDRHILLVDVDNLHDWRRCLRLWPRRGAGGRKKGEADQGDACSRNLRAYQHLTRGPAWCFAWFDFRSSADGCPLTATLVPLAER